MRRLWIVCASCRESWPTLATPTPYLEMQLESQPCPACEAYTLSCVPAPGRGGTVAEPQPRYAGAVHPSEVLAEAWRSTEG